MKFLSLSILLLLMLHAAPLAFASIPTQPATIPASAAISDPQSAQQVQSAPETSPAASAQSSEKKGPAYTLPPDLYRKARDLGRFHARFAWIDFFYGIFVLWVILYWRFGPQFRDWAESFSPNRFLQAVIFAPLLILTMAILGLPSDIYENSVERKYGLNVQSWGSWFWDWTKEQFLAVVLGIILVSILYAVVRSSPRRWWFYFWLVSLRIAVALVFLQPLVVDPMFHKFEPLQQRDPQLTASLEKMVQRAGQNIPPERMFWMGAGEKTTELNAYVTGIGASKRIVVWDNTIAKMNTQQIVFVAGHETGHYVLNHIWKGLLFAAVSLFVLFYLGSRTIDWLLRRFGTAWGIRGVNDWASLPALLLLISIYSFIANP